ncbi:MAG: SHOCT domain-containing protein [Acidimicrobiia bacterium]|nr:SHOCT domain-containing protein [Acidimicrobiia bacterium]
MDDAWQAYIQEAAGISAADELTKLASLKASGVVSDEEYQKLRAKVVS